MRLNDFKKIHFIGIGGAGMSSIARVLLNRGFTVSGSDMKQSRNTDLLSAEGAQIFIGHDANNIKEADCLVVSSAIPHYNSEFKQAKKLNKQILLRAQMLGLLKEKSKFLAIAGTHGKTTTTSLTAVLFEKSGLDPTYLIGGELNDIGSNARNGNGGYIIAEADESDGSFLFLEPDWVVVTNIENDHLDYYTTQRDVDIAFQKFVRKVPDNGLILICGDQAELCDSFKNLNKNIYRYGFSEDNEIRAIDETVEINGSSFTLVVEGEKLGKIEIPIPGRHNIYNSLAAVYLGLRAGLSFETIKDKIRLFKGVQRRFQYIGETSQQITVIDDYAHHPSEIKATLEAAKSGNWKRIWSVFQPHRYTRTKFLWKEFGNSFVNSDYVILTDIYSAGENPEPGVTGKLIVNSLLSFEPDKYVAYIPKNEKIVEFLASNVKAGDLVITLGAGDISNIGREYLELFEN